MVNEKDPIPRSVKVWLPLLFSLVLVGGMLIGMQLKKAPASYSGSTAQQPAVKRVESGRIEELIRYIESRYVDEVDREELVEKAINTILKELDPHSNYISSDQLQDVNEQLEGNFDGIGIEFILLDDTIMVVSPIAGGPSEAVGIIAGDKIVEIEDSIVAGTNHEVRDIVSLLRGKKGTEVRIGVLRSNESNILPFTITRDKIPLNSIDVAYMLDKETGYIRINRFSATTYKEFMQHIEHMVEKEGLKDVVIDVRQNPGGYLQEATNLLSQLFAERDKLLVYTEGKNVQRNDYESTGKPFFPIRKVAALIDEGSASASEIVAGAIQDWDRGIIVGRRSFGKGLVQEQYGLKDGAALRLTVARYYTPSGRLIQKSYDDYEKYDEDVINRLESGELLDEEKITFDDTTKFYTTEGRIVYGGGGISPDIFVPIDTILLNNYYVKLRQHIPQFVYRYMHQHAAVFDQSLKDFKTSYQLPAELFQEFLDYTVDRGIAYEQKQIKACEGPIKQMIKARIARHLYKEEGYYSVINEDDEVVQKALKALKKENPLTAESNR